jgi:hypothetical protein
VSGEQVKDLKVGECGLRLERLWNITKKSSGVFSNAAGNRTWYLPKTSLEGCLNTNLLGRI